MDSLRVRLQIVSAVLMACFTIAVLPVERVRAADTVYTVQPGDTLHTIARRFGISVQALIDANGIADPDRIRVGQRLIIPNANADRQPAAPDAPKADAAPPARVTDSAYVVRTGDSLHKIARRFNVSVEAIRSANDLDSDTILIGQTLVIPGIVATQVLQRAYAGQVFGSQEYVAAISAVLSWLAANDPGAFDRVQQYVWSIQPSESAGVAWSRLRGNTCTVEMPAASLQLTASILFHEASHCQQWLTQGVPSEAAGEAYAYAQQVEFMRSHNFHPALIQFYEQLHAGFASQ